MINLDGQESGHELMPKSECQERVMWRAALALTVEDAIRYSAGRPLDRIRGANEQHSIELHRSIGSHALSMIRDDTERFRYLCDMANVDAVTLRARVLAEIEKNKTREFTKSNKWFRS